MARNPDLTDAQWRKIEPLLPARKAGRRRIDDRTTVEAILLSLRTGCPWRELPPSYGNANTLMSRYNRWKKDGTTGRITAALRFTPPTDYERHRGKATGRTSARSSSATASTRGFLTATTIPTSESWLSNGSPASVSGPTGPLCRRPAPVNAERGNRLTLQRLVCHLHREQDNRQRAARLPEGRMPTAAVPSRVKVTAAIGKPHTPVLC